MSFKEIVIKLDSSIVDAVSDTFFDLSVLSVSIEDEFEGTDKEEPLFNEPGFEVKHLWKHSKLVVLVDDNTNVDELCSEVMDLNDTTFDYEIRNVDDQDWVRLTQSQFQPIKVTDKLYIVPSWHETPDPDVINIILDPGLAFGTGSHPTTFLCLEYIVNHANEFNSVLDYGCGSGILAIAAFKSGASHVVGTDIDEQAIISSLSNAQINNCDINFTLPKGLPQIKYDLVVANILSNPLRILAPALFKLTSTKLILSGILETQVEELQEIYKEYFNVVNCLKIKDGWALLECFNEKK